MEMILFKFGLCWRYICNGKDSLAQLRQRIWWYRCETSRHPANRFGLNHLMLASAMPIGSPRRTFTLMYELYRYPEQLMIHHKKKNWVLHAEAPCHGIKPSWVRQHIHKLHTVPRLGRHGSELVGLLIRYKEQARCMHSWNRDSRYKSEPIDKIRFAKETHREAVGRNQHEWRSTHRTLLHKVERDYPFYAHAWKWIRSCRFQTHFLDSWYERLRRLLKCWMLICYWKMRSK